MQKNAQTQKFHEFKSHFKILDLSNIKVLKLSKSRNKSARNWKHLDYNRY